MLLFKKIEERFPFLAVSEQQEIVCLLADQAENMFAKVKRDGPCDLKNKAAPLIIVHTQKLIAVAQIVESMRSASLISDYEVRVRLLILQAEFREFCGDVRGKNFFYQEAQAVATGVAVLRIESNEKFAELKDKIWRWLLDMTFNKRSQETGDRYKKPLVIGRLALKMHCDGEFSKSGEFYKAFLSSAIEAGFPERDMLLTVAKFCLGFVEKKIEEIKTKPGQTLTKCMATQFPSIKSSDQDEFFLERKSSSPTK